MARLSALLFVALALGTISAVHGAADTISITVSYGDPAPKASSKPAPKAVAVPAKAEAAKGEAEAPAPKAEAPAAKAEEAKPAEPAAAAVPKPVAAVPKPAAKKPAGKPKYPTILAAAEAGKLNTLIAAIKAAGLTGPVTSASSEFTVFAPTDAAFAALLKELDTTAEKLLANKALLTKVLQFHIVPGPAVLSSDITDGTAVDTLLKGEKLFLETADGKVTVVGGATNANVVKADLTAGKSVVHVIDAVLVPL